MTSKTDLHNMTRRTFVQGGASVAALMCCGKAWSVTDNVLPFHARDAAYSPFEKHSTAEEVTSGLELSGKTALITGSNSGIGLETLRVLVLRGAHVIAFARNMDKAEQACALVTSPGVKGTATPVACEQTDYGSVVAAADAVQALGKPIDMVICNAGLNVPKLEQVNGIEKHFAVQHLSHFILVNRLLGLVKAALQGRVVMVSSIMYQDAPPTGIDFDNLSGERGPYDWATMYGQSKLANGLFARELARRLATEAATANVLHPGLIPTHITDVWNGTSPTESPRPHGAWNHDRPWWSWKHADTDTFVKTVPQGAATQCYVATHPSLARVSGAYFRDCHIAVPGPQMRDDAMAAKLWKVSEELTRPFLKTA